MQIHIIENVTLHDCPVYAKAMFCRHEDAGVNL